MRARMKTETRIGLGKEMGSRILIVTAACAAFCGCATSRKSAAEAGPADVVAARRAPETSVSEASVRETAPRRVWTEKQLDALRSFALVESPRLWQTVQMLKAEKASRKASLESLCKEMRDFGRDPEADPDVAALRASFVDLDGSLATIYEKLEEAYIAYKKMQATPGRREYADMMKAALEDGVKEADATAARYRELSKSK